jgi:subtilisin family serine protease
VKGCFCGLAAAIFLLLVFGNVWVMADDGMEKKVLVVFEKQIGEQEIEEIIEAAGGQLTETYGHVNVATVEISEDAILELSKHASVKSVEEDSIVRLKAQVEDWGIRATNTPAAWNSGFTGEGVKISVIDSGIAPHEDLLVAGGVSTVAYTSSYTDDQGHGTHVAGIIGARNNGFGVKGVAYESEIYAVKAFDQNGSAFISDLVEGIDWSIANDMDIINLSAGSQTESVALGSAVNRAYASGLLLVAAAGNDGAPDGLNDTVDYPARYPSVIGVGAVDGSFNRASFSSTGPDVEVAAPGVRVLSTYLNSQYAYLSGTSMATPYVAGQLALLKEAYPALGSEKLRQMLIEHTRDLGTAGRDPLFGYGFIQASSYTEPVAVEEENPLVRVEMSVDKLTAKPGEVRQVSLSAIYENGEAQLVTEQAAWSSENRNVATVSGGRILIEGYGSTAIRASYEGQSAVLIVDVPEPDPQPEADPVVNVEVNPPTSLIGKPGEVLQATASATYKYGSVRNVTAEASWTSANPAVATVSDGRVVLNGYGSTTITVNYEGFAAMMVVNVPDAEPEPNPVTDLKISTSSLTGRAGEAVQVTATAIYKNGETENVANKASWVSANPTVAIAENGRITFKAVGKTEITVTFAGESAVIAVNVQESAESQFQDVTSFYEPAVNYLVQNNITQGISATQFGVSRTITRVDAAVLLAKALNLNLESAPPSGFNDVPDRAVGAVNALKQAGIIGGKTANRFGSYDSMTRGEVAIVLQRAYKLSADGVASPFTDVSDRYREAVNALVANNITNGVSDTKYGVSINITRGQLAVFLYRLSEG